MPAYQCADIDLFLANAEAPVIGVTGTNGKSTVVSPVGHLLQNHRICLWGRRQSRSARLGLVV